MARRMSGAVSCCRQLSYLIRNPPCLPNLPDLNLRNSNSPLPNSIPISFPFPHSRSFAKKRNTQTCDDDYDSGDQDGGAFDIGATVKPAALSQMDAALDALARELTKLRTGRASVGMLDHIIVLANGMKIPLNGMAAVSVLDSKTLSVSPYDPATIKELEKAIVASPLGLNPKVDGQRLIAAIPPLTKEHMQAVCKLVTKSSEDAKQSIRRARQKALDTIKKSAPKKKGKEKAGSSISADDAKKLEKEVEELTKKYIKSVEDMSKAKEKEITES
ncbi:Ribosome-recycling factor, chloroplastic [Heracleum sosnowskyi]|uniref:Ribosome-recycling factor, chloroplastic n=1 Tax=Heracleum sosnowskyi TaxID=360622 RepID=A0AAD8HM23_9APIA|nr:Ribosome-recycling factor, chloroplastic [Heracleum sosnowskyi]